MDPVSQGVVGAALSGSLSRAENVRAAIAIGLCSALLADLDVFIRSAEDPILTLEYHRHFTHSLAFVPIGGLVGALLSLLYWRKTLPFPKRLGFASLGYLTAAPLDACTSYGTHLLWPFSAHRSAWHLISIVDPVFTVSIFLAVACCFFSMRVWLAKTALVFGLLYLSFGAYQREQALSVSKELAEKRGLEVIRFNTKPSLGNLFLWRSTLETENRFWIDAIRVSPFGELKIFEGGSVAKINPEIDFADIPEGSILRDDIGRFSFFSDDYIAWHPGSSDTIGDIRYAMLPDSTEPQWGISLNRKKPEQHVKMVNFRGEGKRKLGVLLDMIFSK